MKITAEQERLDKYRHCKANRKKWGPYLCERSWGTVREDYSADGSAGISDRYQYICLALPSLWFRKTCSWEYENGPMNDGSGETQLKQIKRTPNIAALEIQ